MSNSKTRSNLRLWTLVLTLSIASGGGAFYGATILLTLGESTAVIAGGMVALAALVVSLVLLQNGGSGKSTKVESTAGRSQSEETKHQAGPDAQSDPNHQSSFNQVLGEDEQAEIEEELDRALDNAAEARKECLEAVSSKDFERAESIIEEAQDVFERAYAIDSLTPGNRVIEIEKSRQKLRLLADNLNQVENLLDEATEARAAAERALQMKNLDSARDSLEDLETCINKLRQQQVTTDLVSELEADLETLLEKLDAREIESKVDDLLESSRSSRKSAQELLEEGEINRANKRLDKSLDSLREAEDLATSHDIERLSEVETERDVVRSLQEKAQKRPTNSVLSLLEDGEAAVAMGIEHREANEPEAAVDAFEEAFDIYEEAVDLVHDYDVSMKWEVEERTSMVAGYLEIAREELEDRRQSVRSEFEEAVREAESTLSRAEQHEEVEDLVAARESLSDAIISLDTAKRLAESGVVSDELYENYEALVNQADALHGRLPDEEESGAYRIRDLVESMQILATKIGESPRPDFVNAYGEYPADAYLEVFGSWPEALAAANLDPIDKEARERRTYSRIDILDALRELTRELGHPPSKGEMIESGAMSASPVTSRFADWETALDLAGISDDGLEEPIRVSENLETQTEETREPEADVPPVEQTSELAEYYEAFGNLETVLEGLLEEEPNVSMGDSSPIAQWYDEVYAVWVGEGFESMESYGKQQRERNPFSIHDYRERHGDGEKITRFSAIETRPLKDSHREVLENRGVIEEGVQYMLPVAPESGSRLPIVVRSEADLASARDLLEEFPEKPVAQRVDSELESETDSEKDSSEPDAKTDKDADEIVDRLMKDLGFESSPTH